MARRVAIIGGAGFIGSHLVNRCLDRGDEVHVVARPTSDLSRLRDIMDRIVLHRLLLPDRAALDRCLAEARPEQIYHLGVETRRGQKPDLSDAIDSIDEDQHNLLTLVSAAAAMKQPPRSFVRAGSLAEYGNAPAPFQEDGGTQPVTPYGAGLLAGTQYLRALQPRLPFQVITARLALTYGPKQSKKFLIPALIGACLSCEPLLVERPDDRRDLVHVSDVVKALTLLGDDPPPGIDIINIASGAAPTMREVAGMVVDAVGSDAALVRYNENPIEGGTPEQRGSSDLAREAIGWSPRIPLAEGIRHTVAWERTGRPNEKAEA